MDQPSEQYFMLELLEKGGWVMIPLLLCSLISLTIIIERLIWGPRPSKIMPAPLREELKYLIAQSKFDELLGITRADGSPLAEIMHTAVRNLHKPRAEMLDAMEVTGRSIALGFQRYLSVLGTIAAISPLLGLLGTVFGMIETFTVIETQGVGNAPALAGGISEALITTAVGLTVAIPTLVFYRYFHTKTKKLIVAIESEVLDLIDRLPQDAHSPNPRQLRARDELKREYPI